MSYLALALKYRPKNFTEVVGQEQVVISLENAIRTGRVHHAYLFSGPRGVGKTSLARILAKSLNCLEGPTPNPCDKCLNCLEIANGRSLDIIEIDGASNRGIDEIRILRENVKLSTARSRYKIYIIDEVHMLTQEAFNALLKTLEEPPAHVKFIFATTHPHKVLPTILSRCQKFQFNLISLEKIVGKLKKIITEEKIMIEESVLYAIGRAAGGSIRDAESLLDQLIPIVLERGSLGDIFSFLGIIDEESLNKALNSLIKKELSVCLEFVDKTVKDGKDLGIFLNAFIEHLRNLLLAKISPRSFNELSDVSPRSKDVIFALSKEITSGEILKVIDLLIEAKELSQRLDTVRIPFELALIKYIQPPELSNSSKVNSVRDTKDVIHRDKISNGVKNNPVDNPETPKKRKEVELNIDKDDFDLEIEEIIPEEESLPVKDKQKEKIEDMPQDDAILPQLKSRWREVIAYMRTKRVALASHLAFAQPVSSRGSLAVIAFYPQDHFHKESVESSKNIKFIEESISKIANMTVGIKVVLQKLPDRASSVAFDAAERAGKKNSDVSLKEDSNKKVVDDDGFLNELLDTFGGKFHSDDE